MFRFISIISMACGISAPVTAQTSFSCDWQARADAIVEPWEDNTKTFANGAVRVALLDVIEPAAAAFYLLVLHPPYDELSGRTCTTVGLASGLGYAGIDFENLTADYDPETGLSLQVPVMIYQPEQSFQNAALLTITINQSNGDVTVTQALGHE